MFGDHLYSSEELVAECRAAFLCGTAGIEAATLKDSTAYLANWIKVLKGDARLIVTAAAQAQRTADPASRPQPARRAARRRRVTSVSPQGAVTGRAPSSRFTGETPCRTGCGSHSCASSTRSSCGDAP
jgi:hypothetical protein